MLYSFAAAAVNASTLCAYVHTYVVVGPCGLVGWRWCRWARENSIHYQGVVVFSSAELCAVFSPAQSSSADSLLAARYPEVITLPNHDDNYWPGSGNCSLQSAQLANEVSSIAWKHHHLHCRHLRHALKPRTELELPLPIGLTSLAPVSSVAQSRNFEAKERGM